MLYSLCMLVIVSLIAWIKIPPCVLLLLPQAFISCHWLAFQASLFYSQLLLSYPLDLQWWCFDLSLFPYLMVPFCVVFCFKISSFLFCTSVSLSVLHIGLSLPSSEGGMFWENSIETCILSRVKQITSPGWMHETSAQGWCTGKTQRDGMGREAEGEIGMGTHVNPRLIHVNVWQKPLQYCKVINLQLIKISGKKINWWKKK